MRSAMSVNKPDEIEFTLSVTMPLRRWKELRAQLPTEWPAMDFLSAINEMVSKATTQFSYTPDRAED